MNLASYLTNDGKLNPNAIFQNLKDKRYWIAEFEILKSSIPKSWLNIIKDKRSQKTKVKTLLSLKIGKKILKDTTNKDIRQTFVKSKSVTPYMHAFWQNLFSCDIDWNSVYYFINKTLIDNRVKQVKYKIIHNIIATNENLCKWKIYNTTNCHFCGNTESVDHFFIQCNYLNEFWSTIKHAFELCGIHKQVRYLKYISFGYNIDLEGFKNINIIFSNFSYISFVIYKAYFISNRRTNPCNIMKLLEEELYYLIEYYRRNKIQCKFIEKFKSNITT